jgi:hypothetical protein
MKISESTLVILKNFAAINKSILVKPGNVVSTISEMKTIFAKATVQETFPEQFAIYELSKFLGVLSLFNDPEIEFNEKNMKISSGKQSLLYTYADASMIVTPPEKEITFPSPEIEFNVTQEELQRVVRSAGVLQLPEITVVGDGSVIRLCSGNSKNPSADTFMIDVGTTDKSFNMVFKAENAMKLISTDYNVKISSRGLSLFTSNTVSYYVPTESNSSFNG